MHRFPALALFTLFALTLGSCALHLHGERSVSIPLETWALAETVEDITYTPSGWPQSLGADLYLPRKIGPHPVVIVIHGGGWSGRSRADMDGVSEKLARHGYAALNVSYRFAPLYTYPAQLHDMQQVLRWLSENGEDFDLDLARINTWGFSSGAHLAALVAAIDATGYPPIRAVVAGGIPADLRVYDEGPIIEKFMGGKREQMPERYADASPILHVSAGDPPVFLYHGEFDTLVDDEQSLEYHAALTAVGVDSELYLHRWLGHASLFLLGGDAEDRAIRFLNRHNG